MNTSNWIVKQSCIKDLSKWIEFIKLVQCDFHNLDLVNDPKFLSDIEKNISRGTALHVENSVNLSSIIGTLLYNKKKSHIDCLAVHPSHRRKGIASALLDYMFEHNTNSKLFKVKTFLNSDTNGLPARNFYIKHGFIPQDIIYIDKKYGHTSQLFLKNY